MLWKGDGDFRKGYEKCFSYHPNVISHEETDFRQQTLDILSKTEYICISTDDTTFFAPFTLTKEDMKEVSQFSLRLGKNCTVQEPFSGRKQPALNKYVESNDFLTWDSRHYHPHTNYGYNFGMDGVMYDSTYLKLIKEIPFKKTNDIESYLTNNCRHKINPFIRSFKHSVAVNIPSNNSSGATLADNSLPFEETNKIFLEGKRFRMKEIEEMKVVGCHQTCSLVME